MLLDMLELLTKKAYTVTVENVGSYKLGDKVRIQFDGPVLESFPAQAKAKKIDVIK